MQKNIIKFILFFISVTSFSQVKIPTYFDKLPKVQKKLYLELMASDSLRNSRVNSFLNLNQNYKINHQNVIGKTYVMYDVIDGKPIYRTTDNVVAAQSTNTDQLQVGGSLGLDLDGTGITVGVWDGGPVLTTHPEFSDGGSLSRVVNLQNTNTNGTSDLSNHATHVTGTIAARGANPLAKGMATNVNVITYNFIDDNTEMFSAVIDPNNPIFLSNHSYGVVIENVSDWFVGSYTSGSRDIDNLASTFPQYLMVTSAGNNGTISNPSPLFNGYDKLAGDATAKNNLVIANSNASFNIFTNQFTYPINPSSSQGPTDDLRIKPDIAGDGTDLLSPISTGGYDSYSGTSMSAPNVTGSIVLLQQYYSQLYGSYMLSSTVKALVCHNALDDVATIGPDPFFGWGLLDSKASAETITDSNNGQAIIDELTLTNNSTYSMTFNASSGDDIKATICWTDMPGNTVANGDLNNLTPRLVNDLDLRIVKDGVEYFPWRLDYSDVLGFSNSKGDNIRDNIERVDFVAPDTGTYTLIVTNKGTLEGNGPPFDPQNQNFSLIVTGDNLTLSSDEAKLLTNFLLHPNPSTGEFTISFNMSTIEDVKVDVYDITGRLVLTKDYLASSTRFDQTINIPNANAGMYIVNISSGDNSVSKKLIIN